MDETVSTSLQAGPGLSTVFTAFGQRFFLLDDRTFRSEKDAVDPSHWGKAQEQWLVEQAKAVKAPAYLFNGTGFFGAYRPGESVERDHCDCLTNLGQQLANLPQVFALASGDVHFSEVMEIEAEWIGYKTVELVSSSIQSSYFPYMEKVWWNNRRRCSVAAHNYMLVNSEVLPDGSLSVQSSARGAQSRVFFEHKTIVKK